MKAFALTPTEASGEKRLRAAIRALERKMDFWLKELSRPSERMVIAHPDLCVWMKRRFGFGIRRYVKRGATRGVVLVHLGWVILTVRL